MPYFGRCPEINVITKILLSRFHGGYLWMDEPISINNYLIARLTRLSKTRRDPSAVNVGKKQDKQLAETLKARFKLKKKDRGFDIDSINDDATEFLT